MISLTVLETRSGLAYWEKGNPIKPSGAEPSHLSGPEQLQLPHLTHIKFDNEKKRQKLEKNQATFQKVKDKRRGNTIFKNSIPAQLKIANGERGTRTEIRINYCSSVILRTGKI